MKKAGIKIVLAAIIGLMTYGITGAQPNYQYREMFQELGDQLREYKQANIHPEMLKWKAELESAMNDADLAILDELRAKAKEAGDDMRGRRQEMREKMRGMRNGTCPRDRSKSRREMRGSMRGMNR